MKFFKFMRAWMDFQYAYVEATKRQYGIKRHTWQSVICNIYGYTIQAPIRYVLGVGSFLYLGGFSKCNSEDIYEVIDELKNVTNEYENVWQD